VLHEEKPYPTVAPHTPLLQADDIAAGCVVKDNEGNLEFIGSRWPYNYH
jgi:hypothetical protein